MDNDTVDDMYERVFGKYAFEEIADLPIQAYCKPATGPPPFLKKTSNPPDGSGDDAYETDEEYLQKVRDEYFVNSLDHLIPNANEAIKPIIDEYLQKTRKQK